MYYTLILKPDISLRRKITYIKKKISKKYGYTGSLSNKGVHATLVYLKNYNKLCIDKIYKICNETESFNIKLSGMDYFERIKNDKKYYIIYLKIVSSKDFIKFHNNLTNELKDNIYDSPEFIPHFTIARKNIYEKEFHEIIDEYRNFDLNLNLKIDYIYLGKRSDMFKRWNFKKIYFNNKS